MPKLIGPPPIANLDGIIDLLTNPEKYATYLKDLKGLHDTIKDLCDSYETKEQAQVLLRGAEAKMREAEKAVETAAQEIAALQEVQEKDHAAAMEALRQREATMAAREQQLHVQDRAFAEREQILVTAEARLTTQAQDLHSREQALATRASALDQRESKIKQAQAGLAALGL